MYQSLAHQEVVIIEIRKDETNSTSGTLRISLGDDSSQWTQEIFTTTIQTRGENISSKNIKGEWPQPDTLHLCLSGIDNDRRAIIVNVKDRSHNVIAGDCPTEI